MFIICALLTKETFPLTKGFVLGQLEVIRDHHRWAKICQPGPWDLDVWFRSQGEHSAGLWLCLSAPDWFALFLNYVQLKTKIIFGDTNPVWNQVLCFPMQVSRGWRERTGCHWQQAKFISKQENAHEYTSFLTWVPHCSIYWVPYKGNRRLRMKAAKPCSLPVIIVTHKSHEWGHPGDQPTQFFQPFLRQTLSKHCNHWANAIVVQQIRGKTIVKSDHVSAACCKQL